MKKWMPFASVLFVMMFMVMSLIFGHQPKDPFELIVKGLSLGVMGMVVLRLRDLG